MNINYKGFTYKEEIEYEPELRRRYHYAVDSSGKKLDLDYTQYQPMSEEAFKILVDLNFIERQNSVRPWTEEKLKQYVGGL